MYKRLNTRHNSLNYCGEVFIHFSVFCPGKKEDCCGERFLTLKFDDESL